LLILIAMIMQNNQDVITKCFVKWAINHTRSNGGRDAAEFAQIPTRYFDDHIVQRRLKARRGGLGHLGDTSTWDKQYTYVYRIYYDESDTSQYREMHNAREKTHNHI
jgi:hypothetical protein